MATTLTPRRCEDNAWKVWLKDGAKVAARAMSGWGLLWVVLFVARAWVVRKFFLDNRGFSDVLFMASAFVIEAVHWTIMDAAAEGRVGLGDQVRAIGRMFQWPQTTWLAIARSRLTHLMVIYMALFVMLDVLGTVTAHSPEALKTPRPISPASIEYSFAWWWAALGQTAFLSAFPLMVRHGGLSCLSLPLFSRWQTPGDIAKTLEQESWVKNRSELVNFNWVGLMVFLPAQLLLPPLMPLVELWWIGASLCAHNDIYGQGTGIKALAKAPARAPWLAAPAR